MKIIKELESRFPKSTSKKKYIYVIAECPICKKHFETQKRHVVHGNSTKCKSCATTLSQTTHGSTGTRLFKIWKNIKTRCNNQNDKYYKNYGGRGISICSEWENNFVLFREWSLKNGYKDNLTIDRVDNDGNYEPNNCRWASMTTQLRNTRRIMSTNTTGYRGVSYSCNKYRAYVTCDYKQKYLGLFDTRIDAAIQRDIYVVSNNLEHTLNFKREQVLEWMKEYKGDCNG